MLGENHSLLNDFPNNSDSILNLTRSDGLFAKNAKHYHALDKEIRTLEMRDSPIEDNSMHRLKHQRAELKDMLYRRIVNGAR